jgi:hypothetical protein
MLKNVEEFIVRIKLSPIEIDKNNEKFLPPQKQLKNLTPEYCQKKKKKKKIVLRYILSPSTHLIHKILKIP